MFTTLNDTDLISLGITSFGARKIMMSAIQGTWESFYFQNAEHLSKQVLTF